MGHRDAIDGYTVAHVGETIRLCCDNCRNLPFMTDDRPFISTGDREKLVIEMAILDDTVSYLAQVVRDSELSSQLAEKDMFVTWSKLRESAGCMSRAAHAFAVETRKLVRRDRPTRAAAMRYDLQCVLAHADVVLPLFEAVVRAENDY